MKQTFTYSGTAQYNQHRFYVSEGQQSFDWIQQIYKALQAKNGWNPIWENTYGEKTYYFLTATVCDAGKKLEKKARYECTVDAVGTGFILKDLVEVHDGEVTRLTVKASSLAPGKYGSHRFLVKRNDVDEDTWNQLSTLKRKCATLKAFNPLYVRRCKKFLTVSVIPDVKLISGHYYKLDLKILITDRKGSIQATSCEALETAEQASKRMTNEAWEDANKNISTLDPEVLDMIKNGEIIPNRF